MIILYSTGCPKCNILKNKLNSKGVNFILIEDTDTMIKKGFDLMPVLEVNGKIMDFAEANQWANLQ